MFLGLLCGVLYALTNGLLVLVIKVVVNLVFAKEVSAAEMLGQAPAMLRPLTEKLMEWLPALKAPESNAGYVLIIALVPAVMFLRSLTGYLNLYLMNWAAMLVMIR